MRETDRSIGRQRQDALRQRRRARIAQRFLSGEWGVELESFEADQERDRQQTGCLPEGVGCPPGP
jgi:hypothetical protein